MANVHGIRDLNNQNNRNNRPNQGDNYQRLNEINDQLPFINTMRSNRPPNQQTIPYTLKTICCPDIKLCSTTIIYFILIWIMYIICITQGIQTKNYQVLEIPYQVLYDFGAVNGYPIQHGQVYRLITAGFLHVSLIHILTNSIMLLFIGSRFQKIYPKQTPIVLLVSCITGFMLSVLCDRSQLTVGASTSIFGILGGFISYLIINWKALQKYGPMRQVITCIVCVLVFVSLLFSLGSSIDGIGHLGGLLGGILISLAICPGMQQKHKMMTIIGTAGIIILNFITFLLFFIL